MIPIENKTKSDFELDPYNLKFREYQKRRRQQLINYLHRNKSHINQFGHIVNI